MNDLEKYINEHQEIVAQFRADNSDLLDALRNRFVSFQESGDTVGKYLLSQALIEVLTAAHKAASEALQDKQREAKANLVPVGGSLN